MHEKIGAHHLERKAILYVRQSSAHQVLHNRESSALQYAMRDRLAALGWSHIERWMTILVAQPPAVWPGLDLTGWWRKSASARLAPWRRARYRASPGTAEIGSNSSRCAASSIPS